MGANQESLSHAARAYQGGDFEQAGRICRQALERDTNDADLWCLLGIVRRAQGVLDEAEAHQREALRLRPGFVEALNNLGNVLVLRKSYPEAIDCYRRVLFLRPDHPEASNNLGAALRSVDRMDEALLAYREALRFRPDFPDALSNLGDALTATSKPDEAIPYYEKALRLAPNHAPALTGLGTALAKAERFEEAEAYHREALRLAPTYAEAHSNLGNALAGRHRHEEALGCYRRAIALKPDLAVAHFNEGIALAELGRLEEALDCYRRSLELKPDNPEVFDNIGAVLINQGKPEQAVASFERAPDLAKAHMGRALAWLLLGEYGRGWPEYEWRWRCKEFSRPAFAQPAWDGSSLEGRTILLFAEQGLGDTLHMIRYASLVQARGGTVVVACQKPLLPILARTPGIDRLVASDAEPPPFDVQAPLLSLPRLLGTTLETIPQGRPYLFADPALEERWRRELSGFAGRRIGIAWQGNPKHPGDARRSFPLAQLAPLAGVEGVRLFSLQKGPGSEQLKEVRDPWSVVDLGTTIDEGSGPFMDTAAIMKSLDLVVCTDSALAHLAGGLGVPVWIPLAFAADWRWLLDREDSPWYPSARLFRQRRRGDWSEVFERIAEALRTSPAPLPRNRSILVDIGAGELVDKITILEIKNDRIPDPSARAHVRKELDALKAVRNQSLEPSVELSRLTADLKTVNESLWDVEDAIRACERLGDFGLRFVELARSVYRQNDRRAALKRRINELLGSEIVEEKHYETPGSPES